MFDSQFTFMIITVLYSVLIGGLTALALWATETMKDEPKETNPSSHYLSTTIARDA